MSNQKLKRIRQELVIAQADLAEAQRAPWSLLSKSRVLGIEASIETIRRDIEQERQREKERAKK
jgi:capsule polysaccharide export protein KpsE/RkpR